MKAILQTCGELRISPKGRSMLPYLKEGRDDVIVVPVKNIKKYDIVLYKNSGIYILHRILGFNDDICFICGDNLSVVEKVKKDDIIGVVVKIIRNNKIEIIIDSTFYKLWTFLWYNAKFKRFYFILKKVKNFFKKSLKKLF